MHPFPLHLQLVCLYVQIFWHFPLFYISIYFICSTHSSFCYFLHPFCLNHSICSFLLSKHFVFQCLSPQLFWLFVFFTSTILPLSVALFENFSSNVPPLNTFSRGIHLFHTFVSTFNCFVSFCLFCWLGHHKMSFYHPTSHGYSRVLV